MAKILKSLMIYLPCSLALDGLGHSAEATIDEGDERFNLQGVFGEGSALDIHVHRVAIDSTLIFGAIFDGTTIGRIGFAGDMTGLGAFQCERGSCIGAGSPKGSTQGRLEVDIARLVVGSIRVGNVRGQQLLTITTHAEGGAGEVQVLFEAIDHGLSAAKVCFGSADMQQTCQLFQHPCSEAHSRLLSCLRLPCRQAAGKSCLREKYGRKTLLREPPEAVLEWFNLTMTGFFRLAVFFLACMTNVANVAFATQDPVPVKKAIENWLKTQTQGLPGQVSFEIGNLDPGNQLVPCTTFDISRPSGTQPWGRTNVQVRCINEASWRVYVPVHIRVKLEYMISARPVAQGQVVVAGDLGSQLGDLSELPTNILTDPGFAVGKAATTSIPAGRPLRADMFKAVTAVHQGQTVKVISRGPGFAVTNEGRALNNAVEGQMTQVKLGNGQVVSGIAKSGGTVEINF